MTGLELIAAAKASIEASLAVTKLYRDAKSQIDEIELKTKMGELNSNILDAKENILDLRSTLIEKDEEIQRLTEELKLQKDMIFVTPVYWHMAEKGKDGPFCQKCYDDTKKLVRLQTRDAEHGDAWDCTICNTFYSTKEYDEAMNRELNEGIDGFVV